MLHLLSESQKKVVRREYFYRLLILWLCFSAVLIFAVIIFLLPSYFLSVSKWKLTEERSAALAQSGSEEVKGLSDTLRETERKLSLLKNTGVPASIYGLFVSVIRDASPTIRFYNFQYEPGKLLVSGTSENRESLLAFQKRLKAEPIFSSVDLPVSNFVREKDIPFTISIKGAF